MLEKIGPSIWLTEGENVSFYGFPYPTRSIIIRLEDGALWVWSPVKLTPELRLAVDTLGPVAHLVGPNKIHHLYLQDWWKAYPNAKIWGPESLQKKRKDLPFWPALEDTAPTDWAAEIDQAWFHGSPFMDEIVFFHKASETVIMADLSENFSEQFMLDNWGPFARGIAKFSKIVEGFGYAPLEWRLSFLNRKPARAAYEKMMGWQPKQVIMAHGEWQKAGGTAYLKQAFAWL